jgi:hypothetical protein
MVHRQTGGALPELVEGLKKYHQLPRVSGSERLVRSAGVCKDGWTITSTGAETEPRLGIRMQSANYCKLACQTLLACAPSLAAFPQGARGYWELFAAH